MEHNETELNPRTKGSRSLSGNSRIRPVRSQRRIHFVSVTVDLKIVGEIR